MHLGRSQNENNVCRWLLERFEQGVECRARKHVYLVDDIDSVLCSCRGEGSIVAKLPYVIDAVV